MDEMALFADHLKEGKAAGEKPGDLQDASAQIFSPWPLGCQASPDHQQVS